MVEFFGRTIQIRGVVDESCDIGIDSLANRQERSFLVVFVVEEFIGFFCKERFL